jgi:hypothetical protein
MALIVLRGSIFTDPCARGQRNFKSQWPNGEATYPQWVDYVVAAPHGTFVARTGFGVVKVYDLPRKRVILWKGQEALAEFVGADDFEQTGDVLSLIKISSDDGPGERNCRYPEEAIPERYASLPVVGFRNRITGARTARALAVAANVGDHRKLCALAGLRWQERQ